MLDLLCLSACGGTTGGGTTGGGATPSPPPSASPCIQLPAFGAASAATFPAGFNLPPFPVGSVQRPTATSVGGDGQFAVRAFDACSPNQTPDLIEQTGKGPQPYLSQLQFYAWGASATFPLGGSAQQSCGSADHCFAYQVESSPLRFTTPPRYFTLGQVKDNGSGLITYHLRFASPPAAPSCSGDYAIFEQEEYHETPIYRPYYDGDPPDASDPYAGIQLPPVTRSYRDNAAGLVGTQLCSAGTAASVSALLIQQMVTLGWHTTTSISCAGDTCFQSPDRALANNVFSWSITSATDWAILYHNPSL
jgi:hypothetical protein